MPKQVIKSIASQIGQLTGEIGEELKKQSGEMADKVLEQMGAGIVPPPDAPKVNLEQMKAKDEARSQQAAAQISRQLEQEIEKWRKIREEQLRQRREVTPAPVEPQETLVAPASKPSRRFGMWGKRVKSAQDQSQPELAGRRVGG